MSVLVTEPPGVCAKDARDIYSLIDFTRKKHNIELLTVNYDNYY